MVLVDFGAFFSFSRRGFAFVVVVLVVVVVVIVVLVVIRGCLCGVSL